MSSPGTGIGDPGTGDPGSGIGDPLVRAAHGVIASALASAQKPCITSSFQAECVVLTHMLLQE